MTTLLTTELIDRCHAGSRAKGFWDETPPQGQQLMLVISELAEALEAHRKGRICRLAEPVYESLRRAAHNQDYNYTAMFEEWCKDSVSDELADAYIRLCDFIGGYGLDSAAIVEHATAPTDAALSAELAENFAEALLHISYYVLCARHRDFIQLQALGFAMALIQRLCEREGIDLATHIDLKLRYNATRPRLHAKAY